MLSLTYEITTALSHTDELISPPYDIAIVTISYGRVTKSPVWDTMMSKKNMGWPFYAAVCNYRVCSYRETTLKSIDGFMSNASISMIWYASNLAVLFVFSWIDNGELLNTQIVIPSSKEWTCYGSMNPVESISEILVFLYGWFCAVTPWKWSIRCQELCSC